MISTKECQTSVPKCNKEMYYVYITSWTGLAVIELTKNIVQHKKTTKT